MNRLLKLFDYLAKTSPYSGQGWSQFQNTNSYNSTYGAYNLNWGDVRVGWPLPGVRGRPVHG